MTEEGTAAEEHCPHKHVEEVGFLYKPPRLPLRDSHKFISISEKQDKTSSAKAHFSSSGTRWGPWYEAVCLHPQEEEEG